MSRGRFELALSTLTGPQWQLFENLAAAFLADEFPSLRTMAAESGDGGRDGVLFEVADDPSIVLQYSVRKDWDRKIKDTVDTLLKAPADVTVLTYVTNQVIGPAADDIKALLRKTHRIHLDIRDRSFFLDRQNQSMATRIAAEEFAELVADPLLARDDLVSQRAEALTTQEGKAAVVYLTLQWEDDLRERGLTKLCFEALVRAALRHTDSEHLMTRDEIHAAVGATLPSHPTSEVNMYTDLALERMTKKSVRHWIPEDSYCLTRDERLRLAEGLAELAVLERDLGDELVEVIVRVANGLELVLPTDIEPIVSRVRRVLEYYLMERGESFVHSIASGQIVITLPEDVESLVTRDLEPHPERSELAGAVVSLTSHVIQDLLVSPGTGAQRYLRGLADAYTLFAFLKETPNVQAAVSKLFSYGDIWLDTTAILPVLAETLLDEDDRGYTRLLSAARQSGVSLFVTPGVIEEVLAHMDHAHTCQKIGDSWRSRTPFLFAAYVWSGRPPMDFGDWLAEFRGGNRPHDDLADLLKDEFGIAVQSLQAEVDRADSELRYAMSEFWHEVHTNRGQLDGSTRDPAVTAILARHDVENFLGVIQRRSSAAESGPYGYKTWWLSLDRRAPKVAAELIDRYGLEPFVSPVMTIDFLNYYLAVGPARGQLSKSVEAALPLMTDMSLLDGVPKDLLAVADEVRTRFEGQPERLIRREIRDALDRAKLTPGKLATAGMEAIETDIRAALERSHRPPT